VLLAVAVFVFLSTVHASLTYYAKQQEKVREENERWEKSQEEAHRAQQDAKKAEMDRYEILAMIDF
jgi:flagellar biosynthesis component FlhA